ncbi:MAG: hypothetical protein KC620_26065, partial [Myxococcales bacterium]|nr:hypothetical protein [Myxococcales bacterium]
RTGAPETLLIPLDARDALPAGARVTLLEATHGLPPVAYDAYFQVDLTPGGEPRVRLTADTAQLPPGQYSLRLRVEGPGLAALNVALQLTLAAPSVNTPERLSLHTERNLIFGRGTSAAAPFVLRETSGLARLTDLRVQQVGALVMGDTPIVGTLTATPDATDIAPGGAVGIAYGVDGKLPAGKATGTLRVTARELHEPIDVRVDIDTRIASWWIVVLVAVGVLLGYLTREVLVRYGARQDALGAAQAEFAALQQAERNAEDREFRALLRKARDALESKLGSRDAQVIAQAATAAREARAAAIAGLVARHDQSSQRFADLQTTLRGRPMPQAVSARVNERLDAIHLALRDQRVDDADAGLADFEQRGLLEFRRAWAVWQLDATEALKRVGQLGDLVDVEPKAATQALSALQTEAP